MENRIISEQEFKQYLKNNKINYRYEERLKGINKKVDYSFEIGGSTIRCDVKEWEDKPLKNGPIKSKIKKAQEKFQEYKGRGEPCVLVLFNYGSQLINLCPETIYSAMYGDLGWEISRKTESDECVESKAVFLKGGKMWKGKNEPGNTTISAISVLKHIDPNKHQRLIILKREIKKHEIKKGRELTKEEEQILILNMTPDIEKDYPCQDIPRLEICDNIYATNSLPTEFPSGPYDERYGLKDDLIQRIYVGPELHKIEQEKENAGIE